MFSKKTLYKIAQELHPGYEPRKVETISRDSFERNYKLLEQVKDQILLRINEIDAKFSKENDKVPHKYPKFGWYQTNINIPERLVGFFQAAITHLQTLGELQNKNSIALSEDPDNPTYKSVKNTDFLFNEAGGFFRSVLGNDKYAIYAHSFAVVNQYIKEKNEEDNRYSLRWENLSRRGKDDDEEITFSDPNALYSKPARQNIIKPLSDLNIAYNKAFNSLTYLLENYHKLNDAQVSTSLSNIENAVQAARINSKLGEVENYIKEKKVNLRSQLAQFYRFYTPLYSILNKDLIRSKMPITFGSYSKLNDLVQLSMSMGDPQDKKKKVEDKPTESMPWGSKTYQITEKEEDPNKPTTNNPWAGS